MAPKKSKTSKIKNSTPSVTNTSSTLSFQVSNTGLPQTLPGGRYPTNPYQVDGSRNAFEAKTVEEGFYVRVDLPGVTKDTLEVTFENKKISFTGKEASIYPYESGPRIYHGEITFSLEAMEVSDFNADIKNGVLRMVLTGSGFPPNYTAASSHASRKAPELIQVVKSLDNDVMAMFDRFTMLKPPANFVGTYPFQLDGSAMGAYEMQGLNQEYCFLRIDMPDVEKDGLGLRVRDRKITYGGTGVKGSKYDERKRLYFGEFVMQCPCDCNIVDVNEWITNGVVRLLIKKEKVGADTTERIGDTSSLEASGPR